MIAASVAKPIKLLKIESTFERKSKKRMCKYLQEFQEAQEVQGHLFGPKKRDIECILSTKLDSTC